MFYLFFVLFVGLVLGAYFVCKYALKLDKQKFDNVMSKILKVCVIVYCALSLLTILLPDALNLNYSESDLENTNLGGLAIVKWLSCLAFIMLPLAVFFKKRTIRNIAIYFCTIISVVQLVFYPQFLEAYTAVIGRGLNSLSIASEGFKAFMLNPVFRSIVFGLILGLEIMIPVVLAVQEKHLFNVKSLKEWGYFALVTVLSLLSCIPISVPQHLFGYSNVIFEAWSLPHILWLVFVIAEIIVLYFVFRKKDQDSKMIMLFILSLSLLMQYNQMFGAISINAARFPFQLCNIGSYLVLVALITKSKKIFDFTVIVNVVGVLFALAMPDLDGEGFFYLYNMHFILEHTNVLVIPILALLLNIFPRLDKKSLKHFFFGFLIYFASVFVLGTLFNGIAVATENGFWSANYLFMFDQETAAGFIPFLGELFNVNFNIGIFTFYPLMLLVVYLVFNLICFLVFGVIQLVYFIKDKIQAKRGGDNKEQAVAEEQQPQLEEQA